MFQGENSLLLETGHRLMTLCAPSCSVFGKSFPVSEVKVECLQILFELIFEPQKRAAYLPWSIGKLTVHQLFGNSIIAHPNNVTDPAQLVLD